MLLVRAGPAAKLLSWKVTSRARRAQRPRWVHRRFSSLRISINATYITQLCRFLLIQALQMRTIRLNGDSLSCRNSTHQFTLKLTPGQYFIKVYFRLLHTIRTYLLIHHRQQLERQNRFRTGSVGVNRLDFRLLPMASNQHQVRTMLSRKDWMAFKIQCSCWLRRCGEAFP